MPTNKNTLGQGEESLFGYLEGKVPEPTTGTSEVILTEVPVAVHNSLSVEAILAEAAAKLHQRKSELADEVADLTARVQQAQQQAQVLEQEASKLTSQAQATHLQAQACAAKASACEALAADESVVYPPASRPLTKSAKKSESKLAA